MRRKQRKIVRRVEDLANEYERVRLGQRFVASKRRRGTWYNKKNIVARHFIELYKATGEPVFREAVLMLAHYNCANLDEDPRKTAKHIQRLATYINGEHIPDAVEKLQNQKRISVTQARKIIASDQYRATTFSAYAWLRGGARYRLVTLDENYWSVRDADAAVAVD